MSTPETQLAKPLTVPEFASRIKAKHPQYQSLSDEELTRRVLHKYPSYQDHVDLGDPVTNAAVADAAESRVQTTRTSYLDAQGRSPLGRQLNPDVVQTLKRPKLAPNEEGIVSLATDTETAPTVPSSPVTLDPVIQKQLELTKQQARQREIQQRVAKARQAVQRRRSPFAGVQAGVEGDVTGVNRAALGIAPPISQSLSARGLQQAQQRESIRPQIEAQVRAELQARKQREAAVPTGIISNERIWNPERLNTEADIQREVDLRTREAIPEIAWREQNQPEIDRLTKQYRQAIRASGAIPESGQAKWTAETIAKGGAGLTEFLAGAVKQGGRLTGRLTGGAQSTEQAANTMRVHAEALQRAAMEEGADRNQASQFVSDIAGGLIGSAPEMGLMALGVPAPLAFAIGGGTRATGQGKPAAPAAAKGLATGAAFEMGSAGQGLTRIATRAGGVGLGTAGVELATGATPREAAKTGATNALISLGFNAKEIPKAALDYTVQSPFTPEPVRDALARIGKYDTWLFRSEDGRNMSIYRDPQTGAFGGVEIDAKQADKYDQAVNPGKASKKTRQTSDLEADDYDQLARALGVETKAPAKRLTGQPVEPKAEEPVTPKQPTSVAPEVAQTPEKPLTAEPLVTDRNNIPPISGTPVEPIPEVPFPAVEPTEPASVSPKPSAEAMSPAGQVASIPKDLEPYLDEAKPSRSQPAESAPRSAGALPEVRGAAPLTRGEQTLWTRIEEKAPPEQQEEIRKVAKAIQRVDPQASSVTATAEAAQYVFGGGVDVVLSRERASSRQTLLPARLEQIQSALQPSTKDSRFDAGKKLSAAEKQDVLASMSDSYKDLGAPLVSKGVTDYGERSGYNYDPQYMHTSDITGRKIRHYVTLPDGRKAHPTELYPNLTKTEIDHYAAEQRTAQRESAYRDEQRLQRIAESKSEANYKYTSRGRKIEESYLATNEQGQFVRVDAKDPQDVTFFRSQGFEQPSTVSDQPVKEVPENVQQPATAPVSETNLRLKGTAEAAPISQKAPAVSAKLTDWGSRLKTIAESKNLDDLKALSDEMAAHKDDPKIARLRTIIQAELARARQPELSKTKDQMSPMGDKEINKIEGIPGKPLSKAARKMLAEAERPEGKTIRPKPTHRIGAPKNNPAKNSLEAQVRAHGGIKGADTYRGEIDWLKESGKQGLVNQTSGRPIEQLATALAEEGYGKGVWWEGEPGNVDPHAFLEAVSEDVRSPKHYSSEYDAIEEDPDVKAWDSLTESPYGEEVLERVQSGHAKASDIAEFVRQAKEHGLSDDAADAFIDGLYRTVQEELPRSTQKEEGYSLSEDGTLLDPDGTPLFSRVFHGSPHTFDKFDMSKVGTGEGAQSYGYGLYFTDKKAIAEHYRGALARTTTVDGKPLIRNNKIGGSTGNDHLDTRLIANGGDIDDAIAGLERLAATTAGGESRRSMWQDALDLARDLKVRDAVKTSVGGKTYEVELAPKEDEYLLYDEPLNNQSEKVKAAAREHFERRGFNLKPAMKMRGSEFYDYASASQRYNEEESRQEVQKRGSEYLHSLGIRGIKYLDNSSRSAANYYVLPAEEGGFRVTHPSGRSTTGFATKAEAEQWVAKQQEGATYNYVIFSDADAEIIRQPQFAREYQLGLPSEGLTPQESSPKVDDQRVRLLVEQQARAEAADPERAAAIRKLDEIRRRGLTVDEYARQGTMFEPPPSPEEIKLLKELESPSKRKTESAQSSMFARGGPAEPPPTERPLFAVESNRIALNNKAAKDLFNQAYESLYELKGRVAGAFEKAPVSLAKSVRETGAEGAADLADAIVRAAKTGEGKVVIFSSERTRKHEIFHESSYAANRYLEDRHAHMATLTSGVQWQVMKAQLMRMGYPDEPATLVEEAAAHIADGSYENLGLDREEAIDWMDK